MSRWTRQEEDILKECMQDRTLKEGIALAMTMLDRTRDAIDGKWRRIQASMLPEPPSEVVIDTTSTSEELDSILELLNNCLGDNIEDIKPIKEPWYKRFWNWLKRIFK